MSTNVTVRADNQGGGPYVPYGLDGNDDPNRPSASTKHPKMCHGELKCPRESSKLNDRWH